MNDLRGQLYLLGVKRRSQQRPSAANHIYGMCVGVESVALWLGTVVCPVTCFHPLHSHPPNAVELGIHL